MSRDELCTITGSNASATDQSYTPVTGTQIGGTLSPATISEKRALDVNSYDGALFKFTEVVSPQVTFIGEALEQGSSSATPSTSAAIWRIRRTSVSGTLTTTQYAGTGGFDQVWDDRASLFPGVLFSNTLSIQFDGANDRIEWADNAAIDFTQNDAFSCFAWVKSADASATTIIEKNASNQGYRLYYVSTNLVLELRATGTGDRIRVRVLGARTTIQDGDWHQIGWTYDGSTNASGVNIYIDGVAQSIDVQNDTLTGTLSNAGALTLASRSGGGSNWGPGNIDEFAIWDVELSGANVTTIYNSGIPIDLQGQGSSPITVSLNFWSRQGDGANDAFPVIQDVESSLNGTMVNMTAGDIEGAVPP